MAEIWFSSDPHFKHENIIKFCNRPFKDADEMNEAIIERHNELVKPQDKWYCLGDVTMDRGKTAEAQEGLAFIGRLNGHKRLIGGNHDHYSTKQYLKYFDEVMAMNMFDNMRFTHIPIHPLSMGRASANVHGHTHDYPHYAPVVDPDGKIRPYLNISMEMTDYRPITLGQIKERVRQQAEECGRILAITHGYNLSTQHCEICAQQNQRLERYRCPDHAGI